MRLNALHLLVIGSSLGSKLSLRDTGLRANLFDAIFLFTQLIAPSLFA